MRFRRILPPLSLPLGLLVLLAVVVHGAWPAGTPLGFRTQMTPAFSATVPYTGALVITVDRNGLIRGQYQADSIRPDPLYGRLTPVTGSISGANHVRIQIGNGVRALIVNGTYTADGISGNVSGLRGIWTMRAIRVHLRNPPRPT